LSCHFAALFIDFLITCTNLHFSTLEIHATFLCPSVLNNRTYYTHSPLEIKLQPLYWNLQRIPKQVQEILILIYYGVHTIPKTYQASWFSWT